MQLELVNRRDVKTLRALIVAAVVILNLAIAASAQLFLDARHDDAESLAAAATQSAAHALDGSVSNAAQVTKLALRMAVNECEKELASDGRIVPTKLESYFQIMRTSLPAGAMLHITDRSGRVIFGPGLDPPKPVSYADRYFFHPLMSTAAAHPIWVSNLLDGRSIHTKLIAFVSRYESADGEPAGMVSIAIPASYFQQLLHVPGLGVSGVALIRDASTALVAIYPSSKVDTIGNRRFSPQLAQTIASGVREKSFHALHTGDGVERIDSYLRLSGLPFYLVVGKSANDYLASWHSTKRWVRFAQFAFLIVSLGVAALFARVARRIETMRADEAQRARRDILTGLPNRLALMEYLPGAIARAGRSGSVMAVGLLDLDDFKLVNDRFGHQSGDTLLAEFSRRIMGLVRAGDFFARLGGDEFLLVFEGLSWADAGAQLNWILARIHESVDVAFDLGEGNQLRIGMTMGIALFPRDGEHADVLIRRADAAMYEVKLQKGQRKYWWNADAVQIDKESLAAMLT